MIPLLDLNVACRVSGNGDDYNSTGYASSLGHPCFGRTDLILQTADCGYIFIRFTGFVTHSITLSPLHFSASSYLLLRRLYSVFLPARGVHNVVSSALLIVLSLFNSVNCLWPFIFNDFSFRTAESFLRRKCCRNLIRLIFTEGLSTIHTIVIWNNSVLSVVFFACIRIERTEHKIVYIKKKSPYWAANGGNERW